MIIVWLYPVKSFYLLIASTLTLVKPTSTTSWLDHVICTADAYATIQTMKILYDATTTDHFPLEMTLEIDRLPELSLIHI